MTTETRSFRISAGLKDLMGRELITDDFVAVFELVKNSFDAHATSVRLLFEPDRITIADNGKGMSREAILDRWLFVAYSAKRDGTEDDDYRHRLSARRRSFAGDKGIGRFSCDSLGTDLTLRSRAESHPVQILTLDWTKYEQDPKQEFREIPVEITDAPDFAGAALEPEGDTGTALEITGLRNEWPREKLRRLRRGLAKLVNPFASEDTDFSIRMLVPAEEEADRPAKDFDRINGLIENTLLDVLRGKTTTIRVRTSPSDGHLETALEDRGEVVYRIREPNRYERLRDLDIRADLFYLNRSAKSTFTRRMGLRATNFGSIFVFRNGFPVYPIGEVNDDFFGLARRKQQGVRRYLGTRDIIGRVDVPGVPGVDESTSRDQGLVLTPTVEELIDFVVKKCVRRFERYVVDVTWKDRDDQMIGDLSRMSLDTNRSRIAHLVSQLSDTKDVEILSYSTDLVKIVSEKSQEFESSLTALKLLAERTADAALAARVATVEAEVEKRRAAEAAQREIAIQAQEQASHAENRADKAERARERDAFLVAAQSLDEETILNLHHQIVGQASDVHIGVKRMMRRLRRGETVGEQAWVDFLERVSFRNSQILTAAKFATKGGYRGDAVASAQNLAGYIGDYVETVARLWAPRGIHVECLRNGAGLERRFRPIDVGIVIDNLVSNAAKAKASRIRFAMDSNRAAHPHLTITVADNGGGWPPMFEPVEQVFDKGTTTTDGSGLGLYHVRQVVRRMGGDIEAHRKAYSPELGGAHLTMEIDK